MEILDDRQLRMRCIEIASTRSEPIIWLANEIYEFVGGTGDAEIIRAARELAAKINL